MESDVVVMEGTDCKSALAGDAPIYAGLEIPTSLFNQLMKQSIFDQISEAQLNQYKVMVSRCCNKLEDIELDVFPIILNSSGDIPCSQDSWAGQVLNEYRTFWITNNIVTNPSLSSVLNLYDFLNSFYWKIYRSKLRLQRLSCEERVIHLYHFLSADFLSVLPQERKLEMILSVIFNRHRYDHEVKVANWKYDPDHIDAKSEYTEGGFFVNHTRRKVEGEIEPLAESEERLLIKFFRSFRDEEADYILNELITVHRGKTLYEWLFLLVSDGRDRTRRNEDNSVESYYWFEVTEAFVEGGENRALMNKARLTKELFRLWRHSSYTMHDESDTIESTGFLTGINTNSYWFMIDSDKLLFNGKNLVLNDHLIMSFEVNEDFINIGNGQLPGPANYWIELNKDRYEAEIDILEGEYIRINQINSQWSEYIGLETFSWNSSPKDLGRYHIFQPLMVIGYNPYPELKIRLHQGKPIPAFLLHYYEAYDEYLDHQAYEDLVTELTVELAFLYFTGGASLLKNLRFIAEFRKFNLARNGVWSAEFAANEIIASVGFIRAGLRAIQVPAALAHSFSNYIATVSDEGPQKEIAKKLSVFFFWTLIGSVAGDLASAGIIKILRSNVDDIYDFTRYTNSPTPEEVARVNNKLGFSGQTEIVDDVVDAVNGIPAEIITAVNQYKSTFDDSVNGILDVLLSLDNKFPPGTTNDLHLAYLSWLYPRRKSWAETFGHLDPETPSDLDVLTRLNENGAELVGYWLQISNHSRYAVDLEYLISYKRFMDKPHEVTHITDIHLVIPSGPTGDWAAKAGHGGKNIEPTGGVLDPETPGLPANMQSILVGDGTLIGVGHKTWKKVWFKLPNGSVPPIPAGASTPRARLYQFYNGNWYVKKHKNTIWDKTWDDQRIREELAYLWKNKVEEIEPFPDGRPINGIQPELTIYKSSLSDGTEVTLKHVTIGRQLGLVHEDLIAIITLNL